MAQLFWNLAVSILPADNYAQKLVKLHYLQKLRSHDIIDKNTKNLRCVKCYSPWSEGNYSLKVIPVVSRNHARKVRRLTKLEAKTTKCDKKMAWIKLKLQESTNHRTELVCAVCHKKTKFVMKKPKSVARKPVEAVAPQKPNKKRKKLPFAGLNVNIVSRSQITKPKPVFSPSPSTSTKVNLKSQNQKSNTATVPSTTNNSMMNLAKLLKAKKR